FGSVGVCDFQDDLILVVRLLDEVNVVLGIGSAKQSLEFTDGNAVHAGAVAIDVDVEVWLAAEEIRARRRDEAVVGFQFVAQLVRFRQWCKICPPPGSPAGWGRASPASRAAAAGKRLPAGEARRGSRRYRPTAKE